MVTSTNHVIAGPDLLRARPLALWRFSQHLSANIGEDQKKSYDFSSGSLAITQARSQKFATRGMFWGVWGLGPQSPKANGVKGQSPQLPEAWGLGAEPPALKIFAFFCKMKLNFRAILIENNAFRTWHKNWQPNMIQLGAFNGVYEKWLMMTLQFSCLLAGKS